MKEPIIAGLDAGSASIKTVIARVNDDKLDVIGIGESESEGIKKGVIINIDAAANAIEKSINILKFIKSETALSDSLKALNRIIEHPEFINLLKDIQLHNLTYIDKKFSPSPKLRESLAEELKRPENEVERIMETISESTISTDLLNILHDLKRTNH